MSSGDQFSPDHLLDFLNLTSEHEALEIADRVEAAMYVWRRKANMTHVVTKWENVTELNADGDKNLILASRARGLLLCLKQRFPGLSQTTLDTSKIQYNKVMIDKFRRAKRLNKMNVQITCHLTFLLQDKLFFVKLVCAYTKCYSPHSIFRVVFKFKFERPRQ
jgi:hypothetical protein